MWLSICSSTQTSDFLLAEEYVETTNSDDDEQEEVKDYCKGKAIFFFIHLRDLLIFINFFQIVSRL